MLLLNLIFLEIHLGLYFLFEGKFILKPMFPGVFLKKAEPGSTGINSTTEPREQVISAKSPNFFGP